MTLARLLGFLGPWGIPPDGPAWVALACAALAFVVASAPGTVQYLLARVSSRTFAGACAFVAALLSLGYVAFYLRGGPRIIDATTYFLQGRALAEGHFAWHVPIPTASFRGRFLLLHDDAHRGATLSGIFPPGYPLLLSLGFAVGAPMAVGPALAAALVLATFALARELARETGMDAQACEAVARASALLSVACAALRYHTADTMAHGACALAFACALLAALRARASGLPWLFLLAGGALGFVVSARFASALALGALVFALAWGSASRGRALVACLLGMVPGILLLLAAQYAATGDALSSTQRAYYATSDGPPGCFRYGFGAGIGCLFEHGDFVRARLMDGATTHYGVVSALGTTARRLGHHFADVANLGPLALFALVPFAPFAPFASRAGRGARACLALVGALVLAYVPFYFDGDYPGGGARLYADALPAEHALVALGLVQAAAALGVLRARAIGVFLALSLAGFSVHMAYAHESLRARDGGRPMFDPEDATRAHLPGTHSERASKGPGLLFVDTDHGFNLAHDPAAFDEGATAPLYVARLRGDDLDRLVHERLGRPAAWVYRFREEPAKTVGELEPGARAREWVGSLEPWTAGAPWAGGAETWRFETENEWPPKMQEHAWAEPAWVSDGCASPAGAGRVLSVHADGAAAGAAGVAGVVEIGLPIPHAGWWRIEPRVLRQHAPGVGTLEITYEGHRLAWNLSGGDADAAAPADAPSACEDLMTRTFETTAEGEAQVLVVVSSGTVNLDRIVLRPDPSRAR